MFFLKKQVNREDSALEPTQTLNEENITRIQEGLDPGTEPDLSYQNSTLFNKLFRNQKVYSGPESSFENEAWAPEYQSIRLFRKQRGTAEEQFSSPSGPQ